MEMCQPYFISPPTLSLPLTELINIIAHKLRPIHTHTHTRTHTHTHTHTHTYTQTHTRTQKQTQTHTNPNKPTRTNTDTYIQQHLDALRLYLINSPVVRADVLKFQEEGEQNIKSKRGRVVDREERWREEDPKRLE